MVEVKLVKFPVSVATIFKCRQNPNQLRKKHKQKISTKRTGGDPWQLARQVGNIYGTMVVGVKT